MVARRDASINLTALLRQAPGSDDEVADEGLLEPAAELLAADGLRLAGPLAWSLTVRRTGGDEDDFLVEGEVEGEVVMECRRCLVDVTVPVHAELLYPMSYRPSDDAEIELAEEADDDDVLVFGQPIVDFAPLLVQVLAIDVPLTALCREDCKGLSLDGVNLNEHPEHAAASEARSEKASPFAALKDLDLQD
jgi:uncharacterized protein